MLISAVQQHDYVIHILSHIFFHYGFSIMDLRVSFSDAPLS